MLVLTRERKEEIVINHSLFVTVLEIFEDQATLSFEVSEGTTLTRGKLSHSGTEFVPDPDEPMADPNVGVFDLPLNGAVAIGYGDVVIIVAIVRFDGNKVRLGFIAPRYIDVHRYEVEQRGERRPEPQG